MKQRKCRGVALFGKGHLGERVRSRRGEFAISEIIQNFLQICACIGDSIEISITLTEREVSIRPTGTSGIILEVFLVFRNGQIVKLASEQSVGVFKLALIASLRFAFWRL